MTSAGDIYSELVSDPHTFLRLKEMCQALGGAVVKKPFTIFHNEHSAGKFGCLARPGLGGHNDAWRHEVVDGPGGDQWLPFAQFHADG